MVYKIPIFSTFLSDVCQTQLQSSINGLSDRPVQVRPASHPAAPGVNSCSQPATLSGKIYTAIDRPRSTAAADHNDERRSSVGFALTPTINFLPITSQAATPLLIRL